MEEEVHLTPELTEWKANRDKRRSADSIPTRKSLKNVEEGKLKTVSYVL